MVKTVTNVAAPLPMMNLALETENVTRIHLHARATQVLVGLTVTKRRAPLIEQEWHVLATENVKREHVSVLIAGPQLIVELRPARICAQDMESAMRLQLASVIHDGKEKTAL